MSKDKPNIRSLSLDEIKNFFKVNNEKSFRGQQVYDWLWKKGIKDFDKMSNLNNNLKTLLNNHFFINSLEISKIQKSNDNTIKFAFKLSDYNDIEGVLIPSNRRLTACISSQVGCSLSCKFCATGKLKRLRNLLPDEIYDQVFLINEEVKKIYKRKITNIVFMGMGEPLLNYKNVLKSIEKITSKQGLEISPKRITLSTAGVSKMIKQLADDNIRFNLAISLHAANDKKRNYIMPINKHNSLDVLSDAIIYFYEKTGIRITYEYIIFKNFNDSIQDAVELANFSNITPCKINIIEYNPIDDGEFQKANESKVIEFKNYLESRNLIVNIRKSRGKDIDAACGQLANKLLN